MFQGGGEIRGVRRERDNLESDKYLFVFTVLSSYLIDGQTVDIGIVEVNEVNILSRQVWGVEESS